MLKIDLKVAQTQLPGYYILYIVTEKTLDSLSRIVSTMRFKTGSHKEIQAVALNKTGTQCSYQCFSPEFGVCMCVCVCVAGGGGGVAGILWGLHSQNSHTALGNLTDDFGTGAAP